MPSNGNGVGNEVHDGLLKVRRHPEGERLRVAFEGELDLANATTAEEALLEASRSGAEVVVDLRRLQFLDSSGIALLVAAMQRDDLGKLSFLPSESLEVRRVLRLTGLDQKMVLAEAEQGMPKASAA